MSESLSSHGGDMRKRELSSTMPSSAGDSPVDMTPREVTPDHAAWKDRTPRKTTAKDTETRLDALLDEAIDLSFPASDPIAPPSSPSAEEIIKERKAVLEQAPASQTEAGSKHSIHRNSAI
jgi:hypothetical protein